MSDARRKSSIEQQITISIVAAALVAAIAAATVVAWRYATRTRSAARGNATVDALAEAIGKGASPKPLLDAFVAAGTIRAVTVYGTNGAILAAGGTPSLKGEQICRSLPNGGTVCVEELLQSRGALRRDALIGGAIGAAIAAVLAAALASLVVAATRRRLRTIRVAIEETTRGQTYSTRLGPESGELAPLSLAVNQLLEQIQTRDVTLRRRTTDLESANKDLESFASAVSHDLRAPLGSIAGFAEALEEDYAAGLDDTARECIYWIRQSAKTMSQLVEGLLQMARLSHVEMQRTNVDLSAMARRIATALQRAHPDRAVDFRISENVVANGDEQLLAAVLENLMNNAWKFTSKRPDARIEVGVRDSEGLPAFFVRDNGAGFDPQHAAKMFRPFQRLHSDKEFTGTGIGLATVQKIVQRHGGQAWAEGEPERGATIYFTTSSTQQVPA